MKERLKDRFFMFGAFLVLMGVVITGQLVNLQIVKGEYYDTQSQRRLLNNVQIVAPRGNIVDRNGIPIAVNRLGFVVQMIKTKTDTASLNEMLLRLVNIFEKNNDTYYKSLSKYLTINPFAFGSAVNQSESKLDKWKKEMAVKAKDVELMNTPEEVFRYLRTVKFKIDNKYTDEEAYKIMTMRYETLIRGYSSTSPIVLASDVSEETVAEVEERHNEFPGVTTDVEPKRKYIDAETTAHVVGYVRGLDQSEYERLKDSGYEMNDIIGKSGIELQAEQDLKGKDGQKRIEVDTGGRLTEEIDQKPAQPGNDVVLTLDLKLQKVAMDSLKKNIEMIRNKQGAANVKNNMGDAVAGSVVAMDVNNGEVLVLGNYPSYDPSVFLEGADNKEAQKIITELFDPNNEGKPAFNRAISGRYAPGSTFKPLVGIAGLEEGYITPDTIINDPGVYDVDGMRFTCMEYRNGQPAHGDLKLDRALATSCNIYFHKLGVMMGIDNIDKWARYFGLGDVTGIDIPNEAKGILAGKEYKKKVYNDEWRRADTAQAAIGQLYNAFTPIEMANYVSTLANGGKRFKPHLIKRVISSSDGSVVREEKPQYEQVPIKKETIDAVKKGMVAVTNAEDGTAVSVFHDFPFQVAGKTGTAETGDIHHSNNGVFICYAPANDPKIAIAVVIERGVFGYLAAPVAKDIMAEYFGLNGTGGTEDTVKPDEAVFTR
ncbi:MAG: penicillin-binding protein 2 [Clostridiales bacterium]|jgi:penicillin-binding protein 2|nr:penicillin-binding protein 2 [Eubacteriales bacterium]MDH7566782.1 penicillin-binding protein 2 [Clostridiales bacterium]